MSSSETSYSISWTVGNLLYFLSSVDLEFIYSRQYKKERFILRDNSGMAFKNFTFTLATFDQWHCLLCLGSLTASWAVLLGLYACKKPGLHLLFCFEELRSLSWPPCLDILLWHCLPSLSVGGRGWDFAWENIRSVTSHWACPFSACCPLLPFWGAVGLPRTVTALKGFHLPLVGS